MKKFVIGYYRKCDLLTMTGICSTFIGIILAIKLHFLYATLCMVISGVCDAFDGRLARRYSYDDNAKVYGVQLDSLADVICFGAFPAILTAMQSQYIVSYFICAFYLLCGVIRLAWFNTLAADETAEKNVYIGVPITTASIMYPLVLIMSRLVVPGLVHIIMPTLLLILGVAFISNVRIPKPDIGKILGKIFNSSVINFLIFPAFIVVAADVFYKANFEGSALKNSVATIRAHFLPFLLMLIVVSSAFLFLVSLIGNSRVAKTVSAIITTLLMVVNDIKYAIMDIPVQMSDVNYLNPDNISMMGTATTTIGGWIWKVVIKAIILVAIFICFIVFDNKKHRFKFKNIFIRLIALVLSLVLVVVPTILGVIASPIILKPYGISPDQCTSLPPNDELYYEYGYLQGFFLDSISSNFVKPTGYNKNDTDTAISEAAKLYDGGTWQKANVVVILSESFTDLENMPEVTFDKPLTPYINSYENDDDKLVFDMLVSTFGGASVNTEFEILTGSSLALWPTAFIPYTSYYDEVNAPYAPNLITEFNNNGYHTMYLTPWGKTSYKSEYVYGLFGADEKIYGDQLSGKAKGYYYSDESLMDDIFEQLKDTSEGNYKFIMTATAENHYPYDLERFDSYDVTAYSDTLTEEQLGLIQSYAQGIYDADKELNRLYENIQTLDVPTVIVFYGDHLPHIVDSKENRPYLDSAYFNTDNEALNYIREYTTKGVILANFDLDTSDDLNYINASYLGSYILNRMDLEISDYFKFIDEARSVLPVHNREYAVLNDKIVSLNDLTEEESKMFFDLKCVKYRSFYDYLG